MRTTWENRNRQITFHHHCGCHAQTWVTCPASSKNNIDNSEQNTPKGISCPSAASRISNHISPSLKLHFSLATISRDNCRKSFNSPKSKRWPRAFQVYRQEQLRMRNGKSNQELSTADKLTAQTAEWREVLLFCAPSMVQVIVTQT